MTGTEDNSEGASQHSEELERSASQQGFTDDDAKEAFAQELIAFNTSVEPKLETLIDLFSQGYAVKIQAGTPDRDEVRRLLDLRDALTRDRAMVLRLRAALDHARELLEQRRDELPVTNPANRAVLTKRFNQCIATHRLMDRRQDAQAHAAELTKLLKTCDESIETLETRMIYDDIAAGTPPTGTAPAAADGVNGATATSTPPADATAAEHRHKTPELTRTEAHNPSTKDKATPDHPADDAGKDFGDSTSPHASRTALHGGSGETPLPPSSDRARHPSPRRARGTPLPSCHGSDGPIFGPLRSDIAASSSSSTRATSTPLAYTATGKSLLPTTDSGPDFSLYGQNPFYLNSALKLPLPVEVAYDPATKAPIQSQVQLKPLDPPSFNGNFVYWPRFRDDFIRLVHTPGRYLTDAERLRYLKLALKGTALAIASRYNTSHSSDGAYHQVTAALELEFYRPFQARKVLHHDFLELKPPSNNPDALRAFAEDTISAVNLLREYDSDMNRDCIAIERWMEKIPNQTRLEMCRELDVTTDLTLEDAVRALRKVIYWQTTNAIFSPSCGLGRSAAKSSGTPLAITAGPSGPIITEVKDDESAGGFFGTPKATQDRRAPRCCFCGTIGDHWASRCTVYETTSRRLERAKQLRFCLMCLRKGHAAGAKSCRATFDACRYCHGTHHRALCPEYRNRESPKKKTSNKTKKYRQPRLHHERNSYEGKPQSSQPVRAGAAPPQQKEPRTSRPAALASGSGPVGAGRRADGKGTPAARYAPQRQSLATHAATTSLEESTDGSMKKGTKTTADPAGSSGHRDAEPLKAATPNRSKAQPSGENSEDTSGDNSEDAGSTGHISDAPTEPETDTEEEYDDDDDAQLDGVGTFGAAVPSGAELCRTHLLECVIAEVFNPDNPSRMKTATVFFDCGSSKTFVSDELAADLGLINLGRQELTLDTFANDHSVKLDTFQTKIGLTTTKRQRVILDAAASPKVVRQLRTALISEADVPALRRNRCILIPDYVSPDIVIGRDTQHHFRKRDILPVLPSGFCLVRSTLGTMVAGLGSVRKTANGTPFAPVATPLKTSNAPPGNSQEHDTVSFGSFFATADGDEASHLEQMAENFWKTENIGIEPNSQTPDDLLAHERFKQTTTIDDEGRYQCRLPWKTPDGLSPSNVVLPTYEGMARSRLSSLQRTHQHDPEFLLKYGEAFTTMEEQKVIEKFDPHERNSAQSGQTLHLLAHHAVIKESSATTKVRHVFDGSAHLPGKPSINDSLYRGPVLLPKMASILIRTRLSQILLIADIAKAFHQVSLHPDDRSACAFLWLKDPLKPPTDDNLIYYRFRRVPFGLKPSPFLLGATIEKHLNTIGTPLAKEIWSSCYVDNVILGADTLEEALEKYHLSKEYFASAKMVLRQFASNCSQFNAQLPPEDAAELRNLMNLGYEWDVASDCWRISLAAKAAKGKPKGRKRRKPAELGVLTKRQMLQRLARITDPIGYAQPTLLPVKLAIQEAWIADPDWDDEPLPATLSELWEEATKDFEATTIEIPRRIAPSKIDWLEVHIYVDASKEAYGFATYLRVPGDGYFTTSLAFSRAKVKPLKDVEKMTIPRMELMAFLLGARQAQFMAETLELSRIRRTIIWSDSMIVLQQIRTPEKSKEVFVENRLAEIRRLQAELRFETRYVNTTENPADLVSRGLPAAEIATCDLWWHASPFLALDEAEWPEQPAVLTLPPPEQHAESPLDDPSAEQDGTPSCKAEKRVRFQLPTEAAHAASMEHPPPSSTPMTDGTPSDMALSVWDNPQEGTPSSDAHSGCCGSFRFYTIMKRWRYEQQDRLLAASATVNPLDHTEHEATPTDIEIPSFVTFFNASVREPNPASPPTAILYTDPTRTEDSTPKWLHVRALNMTWGKMQRIYFYVLRAIGAFLRLRRLDTSSRTPLGIDFSKHFAKKCSHANTDGTPSVHDFCGERLYTASDIQIAATAAIWQAQKAHPPPKETIKQLQLVEFHGLLYVKGRLDHSSLAATTKTPLYLPRNSVLTDLIIYDYHRANLHAGVTTTLANVRVRYWFPHGRRTVMTAIKRRCFECRKLTNPAYSIPPWPALPTARTEISRPFAKVGVDFYGPVMLKPMNLDGTPSKELRKYYVCLFTCLSVRAVHCELMNDLSTAQFFHAFKRFAARRTYPQEVLSDNGTTFLAARQTIASILSKRQGRPHASAAADLSPAHKSGAPPADPSFALASRTRRGAQRSCKRSAAGTPAAPHQARGNSLVTGLAVSNENLDAEEELFNFFTYNNITWRTITERAAWKGGVYERMIGLIKSCLSKTLGRTRPSVEDYRTLLAQAELVVNCRPISYINNSERDFTLIRPIDLLIPTLQGQQPLDFMDPDEDANAKEDPDYTPATAEDKFQRRLLKDLALARRLSDQFGKLWREGYLLDLTRQFGKKPPNARHLPTVGDIVLIYDKNLPRTHWRYGLVMELHPSSDGVVREASVRLSETGHNTRRAVNHLFPLKPMLEEQTRPTSAADIATDAEETFPVLMANISVSEISETTETMPNDKENSTPSPSPAETVPTLPRPPTSDAPTSNTAPETKKKTRSRSSSKGPKKPSGTPHGLETRGTPRVSKGPRTPSGSPPKPQIVNDRPARSNSEEDRIRKQYSERNPKNVKKDLRGRRLINNEDWPLDGNLTRSSATAEDEQGSSSTHSRDNSQSPQPKVRSQIVVPPPKAPKTPTKRPSISVPGKGRTSLVPASVALRRPPKPTVKFQRQPKTHKLVTVRRKGKPRGTPRDEPMDTSETATKSQSNTSQTTSGSKKTEATASASSSSGNARSDPRRSAAFIGGKTPSSTQQFRTTQFDKVLKIGTKKRIIDERAQVIPFVDTYVRKDMLTHGARNATRNRELPVTFEWHKRVPPEYMFGFGIAHFSHPASQVPLNLLAAVPSEHVPTIEECAADNVTYDNGYLRGALYGCDPHLTFFTNLQVRQYIKQHILRNPDFTPVGITTGLNYMTPHIEHPWQSVDEMIQTQIAAYTDFVTYAVELHELGDKVIRPLCLNFDQPKKSPRNAIDEGLQILQRLGLPRAYPIYLISWAGTPAQAWEWLRHYPRTVFGFTIEYITRLTDSGNLQFKRELPLNHVFTESFTPVTRPDDTARTSEDVIELAELMQVQVGEDHRHILAQTAFAALNFFFPQEVAPASWYCPPSRQPTPRISVQAKLAAIDVAAAAAAPRTSVAPGGPSARKQKGRQSARALQQGWNQLEDDGSFAAFFQEKMDEFSPHYTTTQEQEIWRERQAFVASTTLNVTVIDTEFRAGLMDQRRRVTERAISIAAATSSQSSAAATAAAAPGTAPATPDHAARAAPAVPVLALDRTPMRIHDAQLPTQNQPPVKTDPPGFKSPATKKSGEKLYTGWEPLEACPGHGRDATHMPLAQALKDYRRICRGVSAERRVDGTQLAPHSFGEMYCVIWAQRFAHFPRTDGTPSASNSSAGTPAELQRRPNFAVHDFMNAILRHEPSAIPQTMNRYFRQVTQGTDQPLFSHGDIGTAILRWYESCPTAAIYLRTFLTGPVNYTPAFLEGCDDEIRNAFLPVWHEFFRQALDYVRLRVYMVQVRRHPQWTTPQEACKLKKSELRRIEVDEHRILQHRQIMLTDTWGDNFLTDLRPDVHVRRLPGLATEAVDLARNYYLGHAVERIYIFWGRDELLHGPGHFTDHLRLLSHHFAHEFPYVRCFLILPPYVQRKHASYRDGIQAVLRAQEGSFANVTLVWFPLDTQLSDFFETARRENRQEVWATALQNPDGTPSGGGIQLRKTFWEQRYDVTLWHSADYDKDKDREQQAANLETIEDLEQQLQQTNLPNDGQLPNAEDDSSAMDHEPSQQGATDAEGTPSVADIPLPAQPEPPRTRHCTAESSGVEIIERDESPGVLSSFSNSPAPGPTADVLPIFQHLISIQTIEPTMQPLINQQTLAVLYPHAGQELLTKMWIDYQKLKLYFYAEQQPAAEAAGTATAVPQPKPSEASSEDAAEEDMDLRLFEVDAKTREERLQQLLDQRESRPQPDSSSPQYEHLSEGDDPLADDPDFPIEDAEDLHIDESILDEEEDATAPRAEGNSPQPMDEQSVSTTEARNSETPSTADETTGGTTARSDSQTSDPWTHDGPTGSDDW